jgi:CDP-glucose 4,6-dehydratase
MEWSGKRVLITGHTGFKGGWLSLDLVGRGATVAGLSLDPDSDPNLFAAADVGSVMDSRISDVRDYASVLSAVQETKPEILFHLAAQPLVRRSYLSPRETFETNVMGTANVLEAVRSVGTCRVVVVITTDKCYQNREWQWGYREIDPLGGHDPYSASKAAAEIVAAGYRSSFFATEDSKNGTALATARAGNVIGGGDWSEDRLVPDLIRAFTSGQSALIRNPHSVRPWQHVLEPVEAYIQLAEKLWEEPARFSSAWNFGPDLLDAKTVGEVVALFVNQWGRDARWEVDSTLQSHEAKLLRLDCSKAALELNWTPRLRIHDAIQMTVDWYRAFYQGYRMMDYTHDQIAAYRELRGREAKAMQTL